MDHPVVLISDDDPQVVKALMRQATLAGLWAVPDFDSHVTDMAKQVSPSLVLLDINQHRDGVELLKELKADPQTRHVKVIMLTACEKPGVRDQCLSLGAHEYMLKPTDPTFIIHVAKLAAEANRERLLLDSRRRNGLER